MLDIVLILILLKVFIECKINNFNKYLIIF